jgi:hypothetical protein
VTYAYLGVEAWAFGEGAEVLACALGCVRCHVRAAREATIGRIRLWASSLYDRRQDRRLGIRTDGLILPPDLCEGCFPYLPLAYRSLERLFARIDVKPGQDVLIDFGSGLGRVPIFAAQRPLKRSIGVELSQVLAARAVENAKAALPKLACRQVEMVACDARAYVVPDDATLFYFFMPFDEPILAAVLDNIKASLDANPRAARIVYVKPNRGPIFLESFAQTRPWMRIRRPEPLSRNTQWVQADVAPVS